MAKLSKGNSKRRVVPTILLATLAAVAGCGGGGLRLAPAGGDVTLDGEPVADAAVMFISAEGGHVASGVTNNQGRFTLSTANRPGAVPGEHRVGITKQNVVDFTLDGGIGEMKIEWLVPQRYGVPDTSGLTATVPQRGANDLRFELTSR